MKKQWLILMSILLIAAQIALCATAETGVGLKGIASDDESRLDGGNLELTLESAEGLMPEEVDQLPLEAGIEEARVEANQAVASNAAAADSDGFVINDGVLEKYQGTETDVTIPSTVTFIGDYAFFGCDAVTSVVIPSSVDEIGEAAFYGCAALTSIAIPDSVMSIGPSAFSGCAKLVGVSIPSSVTVIDDETFYGCSSLPGVSLPSGVERIGAGAFSRCSALTSVSIPSSVIDIDTEAFYKCVSLSSVTIPDSVETIGESAFAGCTALKSVSIPGSVKTVSGNAFRSCTALTTATLAEGVKTIGEEAFYGCTALKKAVIPESVTSIDSTAFKNCSAVKLYVVADSAAYKFAVKYKIPYDIGTVDPTAVSIDEGSSATVMVGEILQLQAVYAPKSATSACTWTTSNKDVAAVAYKGNVAKVKGVSKGTAVITVTTANGLTAHIRVTVPKAPSKITLNTTKRTVAVGETYQLKYTLSASNAKTSCTWSSSKEKVAKVDKKTGLVTGVSKGTATITVVTSNGKKAKCKVTVPKAPTKVTLNKTEVRIPEDSSFKLVPTLKPNGAKTAYTWSSNNDDIATVNGSGVVKAVDIGTATITVRSSNGKTAICVVRVTKAPTQVAFAKSSYSVKKGKTVKLSVNLTPTDADSTLIWSTSNKKIATVSAAGVVKGVKKGTATITVKTLNGKKATVKVKVK